MRFLCLIFGHLWFEFRNGYCVACRRCEREAIFCDRAQHRIYAESIEAK